MLNKMKDFLKSATDAVTSSAPEKIFLTESRSCACPVCGEEQVALETSWACKCGQVMQLHFSGRKNVYLTPAIKNSANELLYCTNSIMQMQGDFLLFALVVNAFTLQARKDNNIAEYKLEPYVLLAGAVNKDTLKVYGRPMQHIKNLFRAMARSKNSESFLVDIKGFGAEGFMSVAKKLNKSDTLDTYLKRILLGQNWSHTVKITKIGDNCPTNNEIMEILWPEDAERLSRQEESKNAAKRMVEYFKNYPRAQESLLPMYKIFQFSSYSYKERQPGSIFITRKCPACGKSVDIEIPAKSETIRKMSIWNKEESTEACSFVSINENIEKLLTVPCECGFDMMSQSVFGKTLKDAVDGNLYTGKIMGKTLPESQFKSYLVAKADICNDRLTVERTPLLDKALLIRFYRMSRQSYNAITTEEEVLFEFKRIFISSDYSVSIARKSPKDDWEVALASYTDEAYQSVNKLIVGVDDIRKFTCIQKNVMDIVKKAECDFKIIPDNILTKDEEGLFSVADIRIFPDTIVWRFLRAHKGDNLVRELERDGMSHFLNQFLKTNDCRLRKLMDVGEIKTANDFYNLLGLTEPIISMISQEKFGIKSLETLQRITQCGQTSGDTIRYVEQERITYEVTFICEKTKISPDECVAQIQKNCKNNLTAASTVAVEWKKLLLMCSKEMARTIFCKLPDNTRLAIKALELVNDVCRKCLICQTNGYPLKKSVESEKYVVEQAEDAILYTLATSDFFVGFKERFIKDAAPVTAYTEKPLIAAAVLREKDAESIKAVFYGYSRNTFISESMPMTFSIWAPYDIKESPEVCSLFEEWKKAI